MANKKFQINFKIPQTKKTIVSNVILGFGFVSILLGLIFTLRVLLTGVYFLLPVIFFVLGAILLFITFAFVKNLYVTFAGFSLVLNGIVMLFAFTNIIPLGIEELWPLSFLAFGFSLIFTELYMYQKVRKLMIIPLVFIFVASIVFFLFSTRILSSEIVNFLIVRWPWILLFLGIILVIVFIIQKVLDKDFNYFIDGSDEKDPDYRF